jgi:hypothetical protein
MILSHLCLSADGETGTRLRARGLWRLARRPVAMRLMLVCQAVFLWLVGGDRLAALPNGAFRLQCLHLWQDGSVQCSQCSSI